MSYPSNPLLPEARAEAVRLVVEHKLPVSVAAQPGDLVQVDTVHLTSTFHKQRRVYLYTAVDVHSRWA